MTRPAGKAAIQIVGDASSFAKSLQRDLNQALRSLDVDVRPLTNKLVAGAKAGVAGVERAFDGLDVTVDRTFDKIGRDAGVAFDTVAGRAAATATTIGNRFQAGGEVAENALEELDRAAGVQFGQMTTKAGVAAVTMSSRLGGAFTVIKGAAIAGLAAVGAGLVAMTVSGLKAAASLEQTTIGLEALLGSAAEAKTFLTELQKFSAATPFEFGDVADASRRILAFGSSVGIARAQVIPTLTTIGDLVSVLGGTAENAQSVIRALGQIASKGKLSQEEILQLAEALPGFNANAAIASATGMSVADTLKAITAGEIDAKTGINALLEGMAKFPGAAGAMAKQAQTLTGVFSTFKDTISIALSDAFAPVIPQIKTTLSEITPVLGQAIGVIAPALGGFLASVLPLIASLVQGLAPILQPLIEGLGAGLAAIGPSLAPLGAALGQVATAIAPLLPVLGQIISALATGLTPIISALAPLLSGIATVIAAIFLPLAPIIVELGSTIGAILLPVATLLGDLFTALAPVIGQIVSALGSALTPIFEALTPIIVTLVEAFTPLIPSLVQIVQAIMPLIDVFVALLGVVLPILTPILKLAGVLIGLLASKAVVPLVELLAKALMLVLSPVEALVGPLTSVGDFLTNLDWGKIGSAIGDAFAAAWDAVVSFFEGLGRWFSDLPGRIGGFLASLPGLLVKFIVFMFDAGIQAVSEGIGLLIGAMLAIPPLLIGALLALPGMLADFFTSLWSGITSLVAAGWDGIVSFFTQAPGRFVAALQTLGPMIGAAFTAALAWAKNAAVSGFNNIVSFIMSVPGRIAGLAGQMLNAGKSLIGGLFNGLKAVGGFIGDIASSIFNGIKGLLNKVISGINSGIAKVDDALPFSLPRLPQLARGGLTTAEGSANLHPQELVLPLEARRTVDLLAAAMREAQAGLAAAGVPGAAPQFEVHVHLSAEPIKELARVEIREVNRSARARVQARTGSSR